MPPIIITAGCLFTCIDTVSHNSSVAVKRQTKKPRPEKIKSGLRAIKEMDRCEFLHRASIPLRELGPNRFPIGIASGCLVDYRGRRWILTVHHATGNQGNWAIEIIGKDETGVEVRQIGPMLFAKLIDVGNQGIDDLDAAYAVVPSDLQPFWQPRNEQAELIDEYPCIIFLSDLSHVPNANAFYGFAGGIRPTEENHYGKKWHGTIPVCYPEMKFIGEEEQYYVFQLPHERTDDRLFKGTSGAPICDTAGNIAALVHGAGPGTDTIRGVKIQFLRSLLDVETLELDRDGKDGSQEPPV
jgi:hypothetical protein